MTSRRADRTPLGSGVALPIGFPTAPHWTVTTPPIRQHPMYFLRFVLPAMLGLGAWLLPLQSKAAARPTPLKQRVDAYLGTRAVEYPKPEEVVSAEVRRAFAATAEAGDTLRFWVFFADKGADAAARLHDGDLMAAMLGRSGARRAKVNRDSLLFVDLPVVRDYTRTIEALGARHRADSRWLNAAAFDLRGDDAGVVDRIAALPFVIEIRPCLRGVRRAAPEDSGGSRAERPVTQAEAATVHGATDYGLSYDQLMQIGSIEGHDSGYTGAGVTLAIFDTGFRTSHDAFAAAFAEGRVIGERDFVQGDTVTANQAGDPANQWDHGTLTWSTAGALWDGNVYGPAYGANFVIAKTEVLGEETIQEEYDWIAAMEWADSLGADVISSSLVFNGYPYSSLDGATVVASIAIGTAADLGIVVCNGVGNSGPNPQTLLAPADAFDMLAVGAVRSSGLIASFSSSGPTADGRLKPEVCARGVSTACAGSGADDQLASASGTSLSTPLAAGLCAQLIQARPHFSPAMIMRVLKESSSQSGAPDNRYGYGILNLSEALKWGARFSIDGDPAVPHITAPGVALAFVDESDMPASAWLWTFGDGDSATVQNPVHGYATAGIYEVTLRIQTILGEFVRSVPNAVVAHTDTLVLVPDTAYAGYAVTAAVDLRNTLPVDSVRVPIDFSAAPVTFDSVALSPRGAGGSVALEAFDGGAGTAVAVADFTGAPLGAGAGPVLTFHFTVDSFVVGGTAGTVVALGPEVHSGAVWYAPAAVDGSIAAHEVLRGDVNDDGDVTAADIIALIRWIFMSQDPPLTTQSGDANADWVLTSADAIYLVNYVFKSGPPPPSP